MKGIKMTKILVVLFCILLVPRLCQAQADTSQLQKDFVNPLVREECVVAHINKDRIIFDSLVAQSFVSNCQGYQGAIAFVRDSEVTDSNILYLNNIILRDRPDFVVMCAMKSLATPALCSWNVK